MNVKRLLCALFILGGMQAPVLADDSGFFIGAGYARTDLNDDNFDEAIDQLGLRAGWMFTDYVGIDLTLTTLGEGSTGGFDTEVGIFALSGLLNLPLGNYFDLYGKLGGARVNASTEFNGTEISDVSSTELYWGVGGEVDFGVVNLFLEYNRFDTDNIDLNTAMAGIKLEF